MDTPANLHPFFAKSQSQTQSQYQATNVKVVLDLNEIVDDESD